MERQEPYGIRTILIAAVAVGVVALLASIAWRQSEDRRSTEEAIAAWERFVTTGRAEDLERAREVSPAMPWPARHPIITAVAASTSVLTVMRLYLVLWRVEHPRQSPPVPPPGPRRTPPGPL